MGRRDRERKEAIQRGELIGIAQSRRNLMLEISKRVIKDAFENPDMEAPWETVYDSIANKIVEALPASLVAVGRTQFHLGQITKDKDWKRIVYSYIDAVLAAMPDKVRRAGRQTWKIRKRPGQSKGRWKFCCWCGNPFYTPQSRCAQKYDSPSCYWAAYRTKAVAISPEFANVQP